MDSTSVTSLVSAAFPDKLPRVRAHIAKILCILAERPRASGTDIARQLGTPVTTAHDYLSRIEQRIAMTAVFTVLSTRVPERAFRCPACRSRNTAPETLFNSSTGRTKVTGLHCHDCHAEAHRGQLSPSLLKALEV